ncbi:MAG TPA: hypothetical protein VMV45_02165 [Casimicrobiaceae bacterium]|nr:hypothetical protein [Casimicrobiaceae bacterium]
MRVRADGLQYTPESCWTAGARCFLDFDSRAAHGRPKPRALVFKPAKIIVRRAPPHVIADITNRVAKLWADYRALPHRVTNPTCSIRRRPGERRDQ